REVDHAHAQARRRCSAVRGGFGFGTWRSASSGWNRHWPPSLRPSIAPASSRRYKVRFEILRDLHISSAVRNSVGMTASRRTGCASPGALHLFDEPLCLGGPHAFELAASEEVQAALCGGAHD